MIISSLLEEGKFITRGWKREKKKIMHKQKMFTHTYHRLMSLPPADPTLYRFFEMIQVFGYPLKAIIHEKVRMDGICMHTCLRD